MKIDDVLIDCILEEVNLEYGGCHNSDRDNPLWGRCAYYRVYSKDGHYLSKITFPVKTLEPRESTRLKLLRAEIKHRVESITEYCTTTWSGQVVIEERDPYSVQCLLDLIKNKYISIHYKKPWTKLLEAS